MFASEFLTNKKTVVMRNKILISSATGLSLMIIAVALVIYGSSCNKSSSNNNADFTGTYIGTLVTPLLTEGDTVIITAGSTSSAVVMYSKTARGSTYTINGTVSGTTLNIPSQLVYVASLNATYTTTGGGSLNGSTITINYSFSGNSLTFTGTK
jgi:hypothetical protein